MAQDDTITGFGAHPVEDVALTMEMFDGAIGRLMEKASKEHHRLSQKAGYVPEILELLSPEDLSSLFAGFDFNLRAACHIAVALEEQAAATQSPRSVNEQEDPACD